MWESYAEVAHCVRLDRFFFPYLPGDKNAFCGHKRVLGRVRVYLENFLS